MAVHSVSEDQLALLMKSYGESIELNTKLMIKIDSVVEIQKNSCLGIDRLCSKIDNQTETLVKSNVELGDKLTDLKIESLNSSASIKSKIYIAFTLMGTIVLTLATILTKVF